MSVRKLLVAIATVPILFVAGEGFAQSEDGERTPERPEAPPSAAAHDGKFTPEQIQQLKQLLIQLEPVAAEADSLVQEYMANGWSGPKQITAAGVWTDVETGLAFAQSQVSARLNSNFDECASGNEISTESLAVYILEKTDNDAAERFLQARDSLCQAIGVFSKLYFAYQQYQYYEANGITLAELPARSQKLGFPGGRTRHLGFTARIAWYPNVQNTLDGGFTLDDRLTYVSQIKWSSDDWRPLNIAKTLRESQGDNSGGICIPMGVSWLWSCFNVLNATPSAVTISAYGKARRYDRTKTVDLGTATIPAPFGYLDQLAQMKNEKIQQLTGNLENRIANLLNIDQQTVAMLVQFSQAAN